MSGKNSQGAPKRKGAALMNQMGYSGMDEIESMLYGNLDDDEDLEAELLALQGEDGSSSKPKPKKREPVNLSMINQLAAEAENYGEVADEDLSDTEDPDLMAELEGLQDDDDDAPPSAPSPKKQAPSGGNMSSVIAERLSLYKQASDNAKSAGDSSKQRRLDRGVKTLEDLLKKANAGKPVAEDDIPPPVAVGAPTQPVKSPSPAPVYEPTTTTSPTPPKEPSTTKEPMSVSSTHDASATPSLSAGKYEYDRFMSKNIGDKEKIWMLTTRQNQYKQAALAAKHSNDIATASKYVKIAKQFDAVITALQNGQPIDLSKMPPPPPGCLGSDAKVHETSSGQTQVKVERSSAQGTGDTKQEEIVVPPPPSAEEEKAIFNAPDAPNSVMEALQQRLAKYKSSEDAAKAAGETSKARRHGRIVKQYQDAIKAHKAGRPVDYDELPTPPGFGPIPVSKAPTPTPSPQHKPTAGVAVAGAAAVSSNHSLQPPAKTQPAGGSPQNARTPSPNRQQQHQQQTTPKQTNLQAQSTRPSLKKSPTSRAEQQAYFLKERMGEYRQAALKAKQNNDIEMAKKYIRIAKGFEPMIQAAESGLPVDLSQVPPSLAEDTEPSFVIVNAADCEISGDRDEVFKKLEQALIQQIRTCASNQQHFNKLGDVLSTTKFQKLEEGCRKDLDALKNAFRHGDPVPKFHYENRTFSLVQGFLKSDKMMGTANVKLLPLESTCTLHDSFDLADGRKSVGGKLEVKIRIRDPLKSKQVEEVKEKWLVIDQFIKTMKQGVTHNKGPGSLPYLYCHIVYAYWCQSGGTTCIEVLKYEKQQLDLQISSLRDKLSTDQLQALLNKSKLLQQKMEQQQAELKQGGMVSLKAYVRQVEREIPAFEEEGRYLAKSGDMHKAQVMLTKVKHAQKEVIVKHIF
ncbi:hypothetical protein KUTeg_016009 [Tegillarca granosa]|uniref:DM14 domain-containing protein n=1 Tax=Tegillarca granosa TaxID=220873 RepID=A0ABQ9EJL2_TEGGR|nr:hypothetical protein KUTeg_016009 [Tegillarca granosa]